MSTRITCNGVPAHLANRLTIKPNVYAFTCVICGKPGMDGNPNAKTHSGACRRAQKAAQDKKTREKAKAKKSK